MRVRGTELRAEEHRGPRLSVVACVFVGLFVASLVSTAVLTSGQHYPSPFAAADDVLSFFAQQSRAVRVQGFLQLGAMLPLAIFSATAVSRLRFLGVNAAGPSLGFAGGLLASAMTGLSGALQWTLSLPALSSSAAAIHALHGLSFAIGGVGMVLPFGIMIAGFAISGGLTRHLPVWVMWLGVVVALVAELSWLGLVWSPAVYLLPAARFSGFVWMIAAGSTLATHRNASAGSSSVVVAEGVT